MKLPLLKDAQVSGKKVFLRADLDVPLLEVSSQKLEVSIEDDTRLRFGLPTVENLLNNGATVIVAGHLGRPHGIDKSLSLESVARWLFEKIEPRGQRLEVSTFGEFNGWKLSDKLSVLENLRFYEGEEKNEPEFAEKLASLADIFVNDAFTVIHRAHASVIGLAKLLPHFAGLRLQKEVDTLGGILEHPKRPLVVVIGGVKIETKLPVISHMVHVADHVLVGGKIAQEAKDFPQSVLVADLTTDGFDITQESVKKFIEIIQEAKTIVWNGPLGLIKEDNIDTEKGTRQVAEAIAKSPAYKVVGGGDTLGYLQRLGIIDKFDFVSTGGGAMLAFLAGENLPGLEALSKATSV